MLAHRPNATHYLLLAEEARAEAATEREAAAQRELLSAAQLWEELATEMAQAFETASVRRPAISSLHR